MSESSIKNCKKTSLVNNLLSADLYELQLPFQQAFSHSKKSRKSSDSFMLRLVDDKGNEGWGEALPRDYVTGEDARSLKKDFAEIAWPALPDIPPQVQGSLRCLVSTALLDLELQASNQHFAERYPKRRDIFSSGVIGSGSRESIIKIAKFYCDLQLPSVKLKVSCLDDLDLLPILRKILGDKCLLRLDANAAFDFETALEFMRQAAAFGVDLIEQPLAVGDEEAAAELRRAGPMRIIADESLTNLKQAENLIKLGACDIFNLRLSKCGGVEPLIEIAKLGRKNGLGLMMGCHVGESALLSAMGSQLAQHLGVSLFEGCFGSYLLAQDICQKDLRFGSSGKIPSFKSESSFGIDLEAAQIIKLSADHLHFSTQDSL
ncbi:enolase C-terminal domain-like protein [Lentisphaera profundi]|uniref:Enolase C-terminal domain-like protein n=1 Tax=Lentisphaera profundi TaxID=1658616 RepID=A0ABY7VQG0_9BACT|nr:enolase C-terminal domain-like protein [Lentisphaera profundi]WDE96420.1 enolase C-terminal domain-like protein [Lentisphaera profundi]